MRTVWDELHRMQEDMDRLFSDAWESELLLPAPSKKQVANFRRPVSDLEETDKEIIARLEIPGMEKKDISITVHENGIEVKAEKNRESKVEKKDTYQHLRSYSGFYRYFPLPERADTEKAAASYREGVLELRIPKKQIAQTKRKQIEVK